MVELIIIGCDFSEGNLLLSWSSKYVSVPYAYKRSALRSVLEGTEQDCKFQS